MSKDSGKKRLHSATEEPAETPKCKVWKENILTLKDVKEAIKKQSSKIPLEGTIGSIGDHAHCVIIFFGKDGDPKAMIKKTPLSNEELVICNWMIIHPDDDFQRNIQEMFYFSLDNNSTEDRFESVDFIEKNIEDYFDEYEESNDPATLPFTAEDLRQCMFRIALGAGDWVETDNINVINRFMTKPGALCMAMTSWR